MPAAPEQTAALLGAVVLDLATTVGRARDLPADRLEALITSLRLYACQLASTIETLRTDRDRRTS